MVGLLGCAMYLLPGLLLGAKPDELFRAALQGQQRNILFEQATPAIKGDLRYIFDAIDRDRSGFLST
ncbi:hypothetical protein QUA54_33760 [Microcoleus sp. MOSTC5]|uniref:hypothetical protein n=1 Tax=Microcoleus sp. MOSTC5 TaxID=3055378 RepID=UPI002FCEC1F5